MGMMKAPASFRGLVTVRADATDPNKILADLQKAFADFKAENDKRLNDKADVVTDEKVDRISAEVSNLQSALDDATARIDAMRVNGGGLETAVRDPEYTEAFSAFFKTGDVQANLRKGADSEGGYVTPIEWDRTILDRLVRISPMRSLAQTITISNAGFSKLFNLKGTASGWVGETTARTETATATFGTLNYVPGEIYANPAATQNILDDAEVNLEAWLAAEVEQEFAFQEGLAFVSGDGSNNRPNGILTYVTGGANAAAHPYGAITTVNSGAAATVTADGIINLIYDLPSEFTAGARFAMNRNTERAVRLLKDGQNNYLWQPSYQQGMPATLAGYAVSEVAAMPDLAASSTSILFGDFARTYLIVDRLGTRVLRDPFTNKPFVQFYTTKRVGGGLLNPETMRAMVTAA